LGRSVLGRLFCGPSHPPPLGPLGQPKAPQAFFRQKWAGCNGCPTRKTSFHSTPPAHRQFGQIEFRGIGEVSALLGRSLVHPFPKGTSLACARRSSLDFEFVCAVPRAHHKKNIAGSQPPVPRLFLRPGNRFASGTPARARPSSPCPAGRLQTIHSFAHEPDIQVIIPQKPCSDRQLNNLFFKDLALLGCSAEAKKRIAPASNGF